MVNSKQIAKNTSYYTLATIFQKVAAFIYFAFISRMVGPENLGKYFFALSFTTVFAIFIDIGLEKVLIRESAKKLEKSQQYFSNILGIKIPLFILTFISIFLITHFQNYPLITKQLIYLAAIVMSLDSFTLSINCVFRGFQNLKYESISTIIGQIIIISIGVFGLLNKMSLHILILALLIGSLFKLIYSLIILIKKYKIFPKLKYDRSIILYLLKITIPFALAGIFLRVYSYIDTILLYNLAGDAAVGFYSIAYRATNSFQFIPMAFVAALFPAMSYYYISSKEALQKTFEKAIFYLLLVGVPISFGIVSLAPEIIVRFFGDSYIPSILPLQILMCNLILLFLNFPAGTLMNACDKEKINTAIMGFVMIINILLNIFLIPIWSYIGASIAAIISTFLLLSFRMYYSYKIIKFNIKPIVKQAIKTLTAGILMLATVIYIKPFVNFYLTILVGGVMYSVGLYAVGGIKTYDIKLVYQAIRHKG
ncbi:flippase [Patescibacteria group bacterium]